MDVVVFGELGNEPLKDLMKELINKQLINLSTVTLLDKAKVCKY